MTTLQRSLHRCIEIENEHRRLKYYLGLKLIGAIREKSNIRDSMDSLQKEYKHLINSIGRDRFAEELFKLRSNISLQV